MIVDLSYNNLYKYVKTAFIAIIILFPQFSDAEWFGDIYFGLYTTTADDLDIHFNGNIVQQYENTDAGQVIGGRIGYWFENLPWVGLAFDLSVFDLNFEDSVHQFDYDDLTISAVPFTALIMARLAFKKTDDHPNGKIQPYIGLGPALFFSGMSEYVPNAAPTDSVLDDTSWGLGFDGRAGITYFIWRTTGIFLEYRYTYFSQSFKRSNAYGTFSLAPTFITNYISFGVSFRF